MKKPLLLPCTLLLSLGLLLPNTTRAQYLQKQMESLRHNIGSSESAADKSGSRFAQAREELSALQQLESYVANDDYTSAIRTVKQAMARTDNPANQKLWQSLLTDLEKEQDKYHVALKKKVDDKIAAAAASVLKAKTVEDLDPVLDDLNNFQNEELNRGGTPFVNRLRNQLSQATSFINRWQNYLEASTSESAARQIEVLNDLINNRSSYRLIDKTRLIEVRKTLFKIQTDKVALLAAGLKPRIAAAKTPDDLLVLLDEVNELQNALPYNTASRKTIERITSTLNNWLSVLQAESSGNSQQVLNNLNNFENNSYNYEGGLIPPELLDSKRQAALAQSSGDYGKKLLSLRPQVDSLLAKALKENNWAPALDSLDQLQNNYQSNNRLRNQISQLKTDLERSNRLQQHLAYNRPTDFFSEARQQLPEDNPWFSFSQSLREPLVLKGLDQFFGLKITIKKGGNLNTVLADTAKSSAAAGNWSQTLQYYKVLNTLNPSCSSGAWAPKLKTTEFYLEGLRLKEAGEKDLAIASFQNVLSADPDGIPRKEALSALKELRTR
jgi:hypothetical protein